MRWYHWVFILGAATSSGLPPLAFLFVVGLVGSLVYDIAPDVIRSLPALPGRAYHSARALTLREPDKALPAPSPEMAALAADLQADDDAPPRRSAAPRPAQQAQAAAPRPAGPRTLTPQEFAGDPLFKALDADPHRFIIGHTQGGKSTAMHAMAQAWASRGEPVIVCDPDAARGQWPGCEVAGYAEDYRGIGQAIERVEVAFDERSRLYADGQRDFEPMHLVIDEVHEVFDNVPGARDFVLGTLGRRGAKRGIRVTIGTQDQNKDTLGLESAAVLSNFITAELQKDEKGRRVATVYRGNAAKRQHVKEYALPPLPGAKTFIKAKEEPAPKCKTHARPVEPMIGRTPKPGFLDYPRRDSGSCVNDALAQLIGRDPELPSWIDGGEFPVLAQRLGLEFAEGMEMFPLLDSGEPVAVLYQTGPSEAHLEYTTDPWRTLAAAQARPMAVFRQKSTAPRRAAVAAEPRPAVVSVRVPERPASPETLLAGLMAETLPAEIKAQVSAISPEREARLAKIIEAQQSVSVERGGGDVHVHVQQVSAAPRVAAPRRGGVNVKDRRRRLAYIDAARRGEKFDPTFKRLGGNRNEMHALFTEHKTVSPH